MQIDKVEQERLMRIALQQAHKAYTKKEVPIGCIVVSADGAILARAHNQVEGKKTQAAHAEISALIKAAKKNNDWRLDGCWVYVTLEPCAMCMNLLLLSRVAGLVYGARSPVFGFSLDKDGPIQLYRKDTMVIIPGVLEDESSRLLKRFFQQKRKKSE